MSALAPHALARDAWRASLRANLAAGDRLIRTVSADPSRAREREEPRPQSSPASGEGKEGGGGDGGERAHRFAKDQLKSFFERIRRLQEEKKAISDDIADVYAEAKANGYDKVALRTVVRLADQDVNERKEQEAIVETYMHALGML